MDHIHFVFASFAELVLYTFDNIDNVVAEFLCLADDIHKVDTALVFIHFIIDIIDIFGANEVAVVVNLALLVVTENEVFFMHILDVGENLEHIGKSLLGVVHHRVDARIDGVVEFGMSIFLAHDGLGDIEATVGNAFDFGDNVEHGGNSQLTIVTQSADAGAIQVVGYLEFQAVAYLHTFFDATKEIV